MITNEDKVKLDLVGLDGNANALMGAFHRAARRQGWAHVRIDAVLAECMGGDYNHLLATLLKNTYTEDPNYDDDDDE